MCRLTHTDALLVSTACVSQHLRSNFEPVTYL